MDEAQRIAYLKHMGVEQYYPGMFWSERKSLYSCCSTRHL